MLLKEDKIFISFLCDFSDLVDEESESEPLEDDLDACVTLYTWGTCVGEHVSPFSYPVLSKPSSLHELFRS